MPNFRDMMRNFLYEEVDDEEEEYEEEPVSSGFTVTTESVAPAAEMQAGMNAAPVDMDLAAQQAAIEAAQMQQRALQEQMAKIQAEQQAAQNAAAANTQPRPFGLSMDQVGRPDNKESAKPYRYDRRKLQTVRQKPVQVEYQAVLSPIFGNIDEDQKSFDSVHDAINLTKPDQLDEMNSIISPMYGSRAFQASQSSEQPVPEYKPKRKKAAPSKEEKSGPRDLADYLSKEPIVIPRPVQKEDE